MSTHVDVAIVGGGPAGSTCARTLIRGGARVAVIDRAAFPRVKLCAGWVSAPIWDVLGLTPGGYPGGLWPWETCHVRYRGRDHAIACRGWFIRRYELDDFLLRTCGAELHLGTSIKEITRGDDGRWEVGGLRARHLVGAGGTHCPVARLLAPPRHAPPVGVQELELPAPADDVARTRLGRDGEPELLLHDDLRGYAWNVPKTDWLNVGCGTLDPSEVRAAWARARAHFRGTGHVPAEADAALDHVKGHSYHLFDPRHVDAAARVDDDDRGGAYLVGDALGLAHPITAEGILPATLSGRLCGEAILSGRPQSYPARLAVHPILADYHRVWALRQTASALRRQASSHGWARPRAMPRALDALADRVASHAVAAGFAWMFSGARLPAPRLVDLALTRGFE